MVPAQVLQEAADVIRKGGIVAFPTETYYGLAVDPFNDVALQKLYELKERPRDKPLLTLISAIDQLLQLAESVPACLAPFIELWPAPLTLVFPARSDLSPHLTGGTGTVGVRLSPHPVAQRFVECCGIPLTATSANRSGMPAACSAQEVREHFAQGLDYIIDGGVTPGGLGSTLVGCIDGQPALLRAGAFAPQKLPCSF